MARYPDSAKPFVDGLFQVPAPELSPSEAEAVCRILLDMPDIGAWRKNALQILPHYRSTVDRLLKQDAVSPDQEQMYRALRWRADLGLDPPRSFVVGDTWRDIGLARACGARGVLVRTGAGAIEEARPQPGLSADAVVDNLAAAVSWILLNR